MADMYLGNESGGFDLVGTTNIKNIDFEEVKISKEDYENLSEEEQKKGVYLVTGLDDIEDGGGRADLISYDNTNSGLGSTNVQGAIDELNSNLDNVNSKIVDLTFDDPITITKEDYTTTSAGIIMVTIQNGTDLGYLTVNSLKLGDIRVFESSSKGAGTIVQWQYIIPKGDTIKIGAMSNISNNYKVLFYPFK